MNEDELKAQIDALQASVKRLETKNSELIDREKVAKAAAEEAQREAEEKATEVAAKSIDVESVRKQYERTIKKMEADLAVRDSDLRTIRVDNAISSELAKSNVRPEMAKALTAMFKMDAQYQDGEATIQGKPVSDYVANYFKSSEGKHFVRAPDNAGGGAQGGSGAADAWDFNSPTFDYDKWFAWAEQPQNTAEANAKAQAAGKTELILK